MRRAKQDSQAGESPRTSSPIRLPEVKRDGHGRSRTSRWKPSRIRGCATVLGRFREGWGGAKSTRRGSGHSQLASSRRGSEDVLVRPRPQIEFRSRPRASWRSNDSPAASISGTSRQSDSFGRLAHETNTQAAVRWRTRTCISSAFKSTSSTEERATLPCELRSRRCVATFLPHSHRVLGLGHTRTLP